MMKGILDSAARTATTTTDDQYNSGSDKIECIHVIIKITAITANTVTPKIQGKDVYGNYYDILTGAASGVATVVLKVGPGLGVTANVSIPDMVPDVWRVVLTHSDGAAITYSVAVNGGDS